MTKYIFVCTGNTCRSPLAESYMRSKFPDLDIQSRGLFVVEDAVNENSLKIIDEENLSKPSKPQNLSQEDIADSKLLVMGQNHKKAILNFYPKANVSLLSDFVGQGNKDIMDPYGGEEKDYRKVLLEISSYIDQIDDKIQ